MTCIVGLVDDGKVYIGGDSAGVAGYDLQVRKDQKVFTNGEFVFGFTTSFRMGQLLRYAFSPPKRHPDTDVMRYMVTDFVDSVRNCLKGGGYASKQGETESGGTFLVGYSGRLFRVCDDYQVGEVAYGFDACGCGESFARGALYASNGTSAKDRVIQALKCAESFSAGVRGPFEIAEV